MCVFIFFIFLLLKSTQKRKYIDKILIISKLGRVDCVSILLKTVSILGILMSKTDFCVEIHVVNGLYIDITGTTRHRKRLFFKGVGYKIDTHILIFLAFFTEMYITRTRTYILLLKRVCCCLITAKNCRSTAIYVLTMSRS